MAQNIDTLYKTILFLIRKNQSASLTATQFGYLWNQEQAAYQDDLLGRFQSRSNGKEGANTGLIENETILTKLSPFTINAILSIASGVAAKPANIIYTLALRIGGAKVFEVSKDELWSLNDDVIDPPSIDDESYYYTQYGANYNFFPNTVTQAELDYIIAPADVKWAYTLDANSRQEYDAANSVQSQWDYNSNLEISKRCLKALGVSFKDADFQNYGNSQILTGD